MLNPCLYIVFKKFAFVSVLPAKSKVIFKNVKLRNYHVLMEISEDAASVHAVIVFYFETLLDAK